MTKIILHLDMNSYFASLEQQAYPSLRGQPVGVAGKGEGERTVIAGASIEAKRLGVDSGMSSWEARRICPNLIIIPANYERYTFISRRIFQLMEKFSPKVDIFSIDEAFLELDEALGWEGAVALAKQIKAIIRRQIGSWVTCSVGISYGKTLAKLASELQKPDGLTLIRPSEFTELAKKTAIEKVCGIGFRLGPRLNQMGIRTLHQLGASPKSVLVEVFGEYTGTWLHSIGNGVDDNKLRSFRQLPQEKSVGHSYTLPRDIHSEEDLKKVLLLLSERVGVRLRRKNLIGRTVFVYLRFWDRTGWGARHSQKEYIMDGYQIYNSGRRILKLNPIMPPVRLVAITVSDLVKRAETTKPLFGEDQGKERLVYSVDQLNNRYGEFTVFRASLTTIKERIFNLPDGRNHRLYLPEITKANPFTKRLF